MVKKSAARSCQGPSWMSLGNIDCIACVALFLILILQFFYILSYVHIQTLPIDFVLGKVLHFCNSFETFMEIM